MHLYTDDHPHTTVRGLGYKNAQVARQTIHKVEQYFDAKQRWQRVPGWTPRTCRPRRYLRTKKSCTRYYRTQQTYRILGMCNRARGSLRRSNHPNALRGAIRVFEQWLAQH